MDGGGADKMHSGNDLGCDDEANFMADDARALADRRRRLGIMTSVMLVQSACVPASRESDFGHRCSRHLRILPRRTQEAQSATRPATSEARRLGIMTP